MVGGADVGVRPTVYVEVASGNGGEDSWPERDARVPLVPWIEALAIADRGAARGSGAPAP